MKGYLYITIDGAGNEYKHPVGVPGDFSSEDVYDTAVFTPKDRSRPAMKLARANFISINDRGINLWGFNSMGQIESWIFGSGIF